MEAYGVSSRSYLSRALQCLDGGTTEGLFYAAFELRCGVEARLQEYLHPHEFIPLSQRTEWRTGKLHRTAEQNFRIGDQIQRVRIYEGNTRLATLFYVPVVARLKAIAERLGDHLHALKQYHPPSDPYWGIFRELLAEGAALLEEATAGTLLGPVLIDRSTGLAQMPTELLSDEHSQLLHSLKGKSVVLEVTYHESLAAAKT